jgi:membrane fusion protein (multidrug efflux system)
VHVAFQTIEGALLVQQRAITEVQSLKRVAVVDEDDVVHMVDVQTGPRVGPEIVVTGNLHPGEQVVVEGIDKVREGARVQPRPAPPLQRNTGTGGETAPSQRPSPGPSAAGGAGATSPGH